LAKRWTQSVGLLAGLGIIYYIGVRPRLLTAGVEPTEAMRGLPGDELIVSPNFQATRAINIAAPSAAVWPWLAQIGRDRTGFYGLDSLSNHGLPSAAYLRQDITPPETGAILDEGLKIMALEPAHYLVYGSFDQPTLSGDPMELSKLFLLESLTPTTTRLTIRTRGYTYGLMAPVINLVYEVYDYLETAEQLENIRSRAETYAQLRGSELRLQINPNV
jgi:hypothetical protein